jgi:hypothetical protein
MSLVKAIVKLGRGYCLIIGGMEAKHYFPATLNSKQRKGCGGKIIGVAERKLVWQHHHPILIS